MFFDILYSIIIAIGLYYGWPCIQPKLNEWWELIQQYYSKYIRKTSTETESASKSDTEPELIDLGTKLLGVRSDYQLYTKNRPDTEWVLAISGTGNVGTGNVGTGKSGTGTSIQVKSAVQTMDGVIIGLGVDNELYQKETIDGSWNKIITQNANNIPMKHITQLISGKIVGISKDDKLYTKETLLSNWDFVSETEYTSIEECSDGTIIGVRYIPNTQSYIYMTTGYLGHTWMPVANDTATSDFALIKNMKFKKPNSNDFYVSDAIINKQLEIRAVNSLTNEKLSSSVFSINIISNSSLKTKINKVAVYKETDSQFYLLILVEGEVYKSSVFDPNAIIVGSGPINLSFVLVPNNYLLDDIYQLKDGTLIGVRVKDGLLYSSPNLSTPWKKVDEAKEMIQIAQNAEGILIGISSDYKMYTRKTLISNWEKENTQFVRYVCVLRDRSLLGLFTDNKIRIYTKGEWSLVSDSLGVKAICQLNDGQLIGITTEGTLVKRNSIFDKGEWKEITNGLCCWMSIQSLK